jgi:hypothetical protein
LNSNRTYLFSTVSNFRGTDGAKAAVVRY